MYYIDNSAVHGRGLYALRMIKEGEVLGTLKGSSTTTDGPYVLWMTEKRGFEVSCELRFINRSKKPNAIYYDDLTVVALSNIEPNEEIMHDYGDDWL